MTRYSLSQSQKDNLVVHIGNMDDKTFGKMIAKVLEKYGQGTAESNSSQQLLTKLRDQNLPLPYLKQKVLQYIQAEHNNGKRLLNIIRVAILDLLFKVPSQEDMNGFNGDNLETRKLMSQGYTQDGGDDDYEAEGLPNPSNVDEDFVATVSKQIERLYTNGQSMFGIGNNKKATAIEKALRNYIQKPTETNMLLVNDVLSIERFSLTNNSSSSKPTSLTEVEDEIRGRTNAYKC